jgi:hypothetical protein
LRIIGALPDHSSVTFDYIAAPTSDAQSEFLKAFQKGVGELGEPATPTNAPDDLAARARSFGFTHTEDYSHCDFLTHLGATWPSAAANSIFRVMYARKQRKA